MTVGSAGAVRVPGVANADLVAEFRALHLPGEPLLLPNPWDAGSARILAALGYRALATTSSGYAATLGRLDGTVTRSQALDHAATIVAATDLPVSADLENGFADKPDGVAETISAAIRTGLAGCSVEDFTGNADTPIYDAGLAAQRVAAAAEAAHGGADQLVLTARAENYLHGREDLADTIARLQSYQRAGADVVYAPGLSRPDDIRAIVTSVGERTALGVARISVGGAFAYAALGGLIDAARELREQGTYGFWERSAVGRDFANDAFGDRS